MRKKYISCACGAMGILIAILPRLVICPANADGSVMACGQIANAMSFTGVILLAAALVSALARTELIRFCSHVFSGSLAVLGMPVLLGVLRGCSDPGMPCHTTATPLICVMLLLAAGISALGIADCMLRQKGRKHGKRMKDYK